MGYKTIQRNKISGQHEQVEAPLGKEYGRNEIVKREEARQAELESAIASDSSKQGVAGDTLQHPAWDEAISRLKADRDRENAETNAAESDKPELTARKTKRT